jgi:hypothetical protein
MVVQCANLKARSFKTSDHKERPRNYHFRGFSYVTNSMDKQTCVNCGKDAHLNRYGICQNCFNLSNYLDELVSEVVGGEVDAGDPHRPALGGRSQPPTPV